MTNHFRDKNDLMSDPAVSPLTTDPDIPAAGKMFYGWWMVVAGMAVLIVSSGIGFYGHGVILDPLTRLHGWSKGLVSSAVTLYFLTGGVAGLFTGRIIDRYGPKPVLVIG
ncbi:MAG: MFS transporter, partial [Proteobacteria bacterium]|nr:MFS transporter [Pseudomonadota bacterium]